MKTPVYTISGFLGAGKTTFVNKLLSRLNGSVNVAVIVNELGQIAIDGRIIDRRDYVLKEITDGCICCTLKAKLVDTLIAIVEDHAPDFILLETTGVARPKQIVSEFHLKRMSERIFSKRIICFLDAVVYARVGHNMPIINFQIEDADVIILNKIDLIEKKDLALMRDRLKSFTGGNKTIHETSYGEIDYGGLFPEINGGRMFEKKDGFRKPLDRSPLPVAHPLACDKEFLNSTAGFSTIPLEAKSPVSEAFLKAFFSRHKAEIIRAKGLLKTKGGNKVLHFSSSGLHMEDFHKGLKKSELVLIVKERNKERVESSILDAFDHPVSDPLKTGPKAIQESLQASRETQN
jgi:G3E family GTPase